MKILNIFYSCTGNTKKIASQIEKTIKELNHEFLTVEVKKDTNENSFNFLDYDFVFIGSGVYSWLPPQIMIDFMKKAQQKHIKQGLVKPASPRINGKRAVAYASYGGVHTGMNEAVITPKYLAQPLDHIGIEIIAEWLFEGEFNAEAYRQYSTNGRLGDITGRPNEQDLQKIHEMVTGILRA